MLVPVRVPRVYEQIAARLERAIVDGSLQHGDKLPPERRLARQFGASRVAVREALRALELRGLVEVRQGAAGGYFIRDLDAGPLCRDFETLLRLGRVSRGQVTEARLFIEPEIARLAALRATDADLKALGAALDAPDPPGAGDAHAADAAVHRLIADAAHNPVFAMIAHALNDLDGPRPAGGGDDGPRAAAAAHREILAAITTRQPALAHAAMAAHVADRERRDGRASALPEAG